MKVFKLVIAVAVFSALLFGFVLPALISSSHTEGVLAGFGLILLVVYFVGKFVIEKVFSNE